MTQRIARMTRRSFIASMAGAGLALSGCGSNADEGDDSAGVSDAAQINAEDAVEGLAGTCAIHVQGYDWGAGVDKVTVNGVSCQTLQVTNTQAVAQYLSSIGVSSGGFGYIEVTFDQTAARAAAKEFFTDASGARQPWLVFQFSTTGTRADSVKVVDSFTLYQAPV